MGEFRTRYVCDECKKRAWQIKHYDPYGTRGIIAITGSHKVKGKVLCDKCYMGASLAGLLKEIQEFKKHERSVRVATEAIKRILETS